MSDFAAVRGPKGRLSEAPGMSMLMGGGAGYYARRGANPVRAGYLQTVNGVELLAMRDPIELLRMLKAVVPELDQASWNFKRIGLDPDNLRLKAMAYNAQGEGDEAPDGTQILSDFWDKQDAEVGGFLGALGQNLEMVLPYGMSAGEFVPLAGPSGVGEWWPIQPNSIEFRRDPKGYLTLWQKQRRILKGDALSRSSFVQLPMSRTFWGSLDPTPDNPYGQSPFSTALTEILVNLCFLRDVIIAMHRVGMPRVDVGFDFEMWYRIAEKYPDLVAEMDVKDWVNAKFKEAQNTCNSIGPDEWFFHDLNSKVSVIGSGGQWPNIAEIYGIFRWRLVIALKQLPVLMGIVDGTTETWSTTAWKIWTAGLNALLTVAADPLVKTGTALLQGIHGLPYRAELEIKPVRTSQRLADAQAQQLEIANELAMVRAGWQDNDSASTHVTGSAAVADPQPGVIEPLPSPSGNNPNNPGTNPGGQNNSDRNADVERQRLRMEWDARLIAELQTELKSKNGVR